MYRDAQRLEFSETAGGLAVRVEIPFSRTPATGEAAFRVA
jgi:hypothetical protein